MYLTYNVSDKPKFGNLIVFAIQQLLAIMAATIAIPMIVSQATGVQMSISAALVGALFGGAPNTTYGESTGCVVITGNASTITILVTAILAIIVAFISPFVAFLDSITACVMGGVCVALYGFISVSGLKMLQGVDLEDNDNLFTASTILILGVGGLVISFGSWTITKIACALILGIVVNVISRIKKK